MGAAELGPWEPLDVASVADTFAAAPFRWWLSGGWALELYMGRGWRPHEDTDVGVVRADLGAVHEFLRGWDLHIAAAGRLTPWGGEPLDAARDQNNVWCRQVPGGPWVLDITIGDGTDDHWVYRRDPSIRLRWDAAVLRTADGVPYLAPELQLLFKSKGMRPKDNADAAEVIPHLDDLQRGRLQQWLPQEHPWR